MDTGLSMKYVLDKIASRNPASLRAATLLRKPAAAKVEVDVEYVGFDIDNLFVIGYGLDYGQLARNLRAIYILGEEDADAGPFGLPRGSLVLRHSSSDRLVPVVRRAWGRGPRADVVPSAHVLRSTPPCTRPPVNLSVTQH